MAEAKDEKDKKKQGKDQKQRSNNTARLMDEHKVPADQMTTLQRTLAKESSEDNG